MILDWLGVSMTTDEGTVEYPTATGAVMWADTAYAATLARRRTASAAVAGVTSDPTRTSRPPSSGTSTD